MVKKFAFVLFVALVCCAPAFADSSVKINNKSKWEIHHLYLAPHSSDEWGPDQLKDAVIATGASFTLTGVPCDKYDVKVVDEDGDECVIEDAAICHDKAFWNITDEELLACEKESETNNRP